MVTDKLREAECGLAGQLKPRVATLREAPTFSRIDPDDVNFDHLAEVVVSGFSTVVTPPSYSLKSLYKPTLKGWGIMLLFLEGEVST